MVDPTAPEPFDHLFLARSRTALLSQFKRSNFELEHSEGISFRISYQRELCRSVSSGIRLASSWIDVRRSVLWRLHLVAWTSTFASLTETVMWRAASVTIVLTGPSYAIIAICASGFAWLDARSNVLADLHIIFCGFLILSTLLWYTLCRASLVVECFIHLAHIPESALHVPSWATYIPSFT
jgi:hypothetical protein